MKIEKLENKIIIAADLREKSVWVNCLGYLVHKHDSGYINTITGASVQSILELIHRLNFAGADDDLKPVEKHANNPTIEISVPEINLTTNCLGYLCYAKTPKNFRSLIGAEVSEVVKLNEQLLSISR